MKREKIRWGFIGCGEVTKYKSGPAFQKIEGSQWCQSQDIRQGAQHSQMV